MKHTCKMPNNLLYRGQIDYKRHGHKSQTIGPYGILSGDKNGISFSRFSISFFSCVLKNNYCFFQYMSWNLKVVLKTHEKRNIEPWTLMSKKY